jgi:glycosyltransferase involved in cell wall biosynthesis
MPSSNVERPQKPIVSIIICTYNRKTTLQMCLGSILEQNYPRSDFEVIIVDGGSTDGTHELVTEKFPTARLIVENRAGLAVARNKGAEQAHGRFVAYTDDDCIVDRQWLENLVAGFELSGSVVGVGGPVYSMHPEVIPQRILVKAPLGLHSDGESVKVVGSLVGANFAFKHEVFKTTRFDEKFGRANATRFGKLMLTGEDTEFCHSLTDSGYTLLYTPYAKVYHQIRKERLKVPYIIRHAIHNGLSQARFLLKRYPRIVATRHALSETGQFLLALKHDRSFTSCYNLVYSFSAFLCIITGLDKILM